VRENGRVGFEKIAIGCPPSDISALATVKKPSLDRKHTTISPLSKRAETFQYTGVAVVI
jgi:hypothetical protein